MNITIRITRPPLAPPGLLSQHTPLKTIRLDLAVVVPTPKLPEPERS
jgi:hypothetical protein